MKCAGWEAGVLQKFTKIYRRSLNLLDKNRPVCNIRVAGFWDCLFKELMGSCYDLLTESNTRFTAFSNEYCKIFDNFS